MHSSNDFTRMDEEVRNLSFKIHHAKYILYFLFIILTIRLWHLQIYKGSVLRAYSENNRLKAQNIPAPRGLIFSQDRSILANNHPALELSLTPQYSKDLKKVSAVLAPIVNIPAQKILKKLKKSKKQSGLFFPVSIKKELSLKQAYRLRLLKSEFPELNIQEYIIRYYPFHNQTAHIMGYTGEISKKQISKFNNKFRGQLHFKAGDLIGKHGIEEAWEKELRGHDGTSFIEVDAYSRYVLTSHEFFNLQPKKPVPGRHLILTLDKDIQLSAFKAMNRKDSIGPRKGAVVVMKTNGEILAWISSPSFDPNLFSKILSRNYWTQLSQNPDRPLVNKVIQNHHPPGSMIKPFLALAALQDGIITASSKINSPSKIRLGRRFFHDHRKTDAGEITVQQAIEASSNTFFYQLGQQIGINRMAFYMKQFGFNKKTNIQLTGEVAGLIPTKKWKEETVGEPWQGGEDLVHAIGQGYTLVTPLQMAVAFNAIATGGKIVKPFLVKTVINSNNEVLESFSGRIEEDLSLIIDSSHFRTVQQALKQVIYGQQGTARWWKLKNHTLAGKTGTSQTQSFTKSNLYKDCKKQPIKTRHHGWFSAFAPAENPEVTVVVFTEHSCAGSSGSAPIARDILKTYFAKYATQNKEK